MLLGLGEETGGVYGREWGWQAAKTCLCEAWWQRLAIRSRVQAALPGMGCVLTSPLWPSVKWDYVLSCLPHRTLEGEWKKRLRCYPTTSRHPKGDLVVEPSWEGGVGGDKVGSRAFIPVGPGRS